MSTKLTPTLSEPERALSAAAGLWIFFLGLFRRRTLPTALGGYLIFRAISGTCKVAEILRSPIADDAEVDSKAQTKKAK